MSIDKKASNYIKDLYNEPTDLLETYEAYKDGYRDGSMNVSWTDKIAYSAIGIIFFSLLLLVIDHFTNGSIFK